MKMRIENKTVSKATNGGRYGGIGSVMQKEMDLIIYEFVM